MKIEGSFMEVNKPPPPVIRDCALPLHLYREIPIDNVLREAEGSKAQKIWYM
jgi:hypothetical protein